MAYKMNNLNELVQTSVMLSVCDRIYEKVRNIVWHSVMNIVCNTEGDNGYDIIDDIVKNRLKTPNSWRSVNKSSVLKGLQS